jgi:meso-butanediol dehydrogenase/(S,S)-butanediol dehydrogenase/diacetyl reductase
MRGLKSFREKTVLVTGASSGVGRALAARFAREGARAVALVARREARLQSGREVEASARALALPCDVADRAAVLATADGAQAELASTCW